MEKYSKALEKYFRLASYISAAQIFLKDNILLERELEPEDIKDRLLGHWGTTPAINLVYGAINAAIKENPKYNFLYIVGPGHGYPAYQAGVFLDSSLSYFYKDIPYSKDGLKKVITEFSVPYGFPSHINPDAPGAILEGGELGYSLSVGYGSVLDNPDLISVVLVGDGEAETGPLSAAWPLNRFINPKTDGAVLPILHLNSYKISGPTIFSSMSNDDIVKYFESLSYEPLLIDFDKDLIFNKTLQAFEIAISKILSIKSAWAEKYGLPRWPVIILKTPKGWGAPDYINGRKIEGNYLSHQVVFSKLKESKEEIAVLENWLRGYKIDELISFDNEELLILDDDLEFLLEKGDRSIGKSKAALQKARELKLPDPPSVLSGHTQNIDSMRLVGEYFAQIIKDNNNFRIFSPDETYSNHLDAVFKVSSRVWIPGKKEWEEDISSHGKVIELLSEHELFGMLQGYILTGRHGSFVSYEAFAEIVSSMLDQYVKFLKFARNVHWRPDYASLNIILSSLLERQDHNGFSHQNPSFISNNTDRDLDIVNVYLPADKQIALFSLHKALSEKNQVNIFAIGKRLKDTFLSVDEAKEHVEKDASVWKRYSDKNPDIVFASAGDYVTREMLFALDLLREHLPGIKVAFVNFNKLDVIEEKGRAVLLELFAGLPVLFHYHGYASTIKKLIFGRYEADKIHISGYREQGSTTTPFDMLARNELTRFDALVSSAHLLARFGKISYNKADELADFARKSKKELIDYIKENKKDPKEFSY